MYVLQTCGLTKAYGGRCVVDRFDMHVQQGDVYGFVGKNGAGKSTVMKMVMGLVAPTAGTIALFGEDVAADGDACRRRIGALIEAPGLLPASSAFDTLMARALALGIPDARDRCHEIMRLVGLSAVGRKRTKRFSQGMKQRLGIGLALLGSPDLLLLDEPFNGLDPEGTRDIRSLIMRLNETFGVTVVVSSHVLDQLDRMVTRYGVISGGRMVREMSAQEVKEECGHSLRVRTSAPELTLVALQEAFPQIAMRVDPDRSLCITGTFDGEAIAQVLHAQEPSVLELSEIERDMEEYFVALMDKEAPSC